MSIAVLIQVHEEARRLAIAGAAVAGGDFRLKKLVAPLEQAGAKAPVFARVAHAARAVVESNETNASAALLDLASLVNAILYTQSETGIAGELTPLETTDLGTRETQTSARILKPLLDALSSNGSGRLELVREAIDRGTFKDLRLVKPALHALDDSYPEIASLIAEKVLPLYGRAIVPELKARLDLKGRAGHVHRLRLLHTLDPEGTRDIIKRALDEGSKEIRVVAIECLGTTGSDLSYLLDQTRSKARDVRAAALRALTGASHTASEIIGVLKRAITGPDLELLVERLAKTGLAEVQEFVLTQAEKQLADTLAEKDAKKQGPAVERLMQFARSVEGREDSSAEAFLLKCFDAVPALARIKSTPSGQDFNELLARVMSESSPTLQRRLVDSHETLTGEMLQSAYIAARQTMAPAEFFNEFNSVLAGTAAPKSRKGAQRERAEALVSVLTARDGRGYVHPWVDSADHEPSDSPRRALDPRWLDAGVEAGAVELVCALARPGHTKAGKLLTENLDGAKPEEVPRLLHGMIRMNLPGVTELLLGAIKKESKPHYSYLLHWLGGLITELPRSELPKIEAALPTLPEKTVDQLMDWVLELKNKPE